MALRFLTLNGGSAIGLILVLNAAAGVLFIVVGGESAATGTILLMYLLDFLAGGLAIVHPSQCCSSRWLPCWAC